VRYGSSGKLGRRVSVAGDHNEFRWGLFVSAVAIAVAAAAGAVGATNPNSKWVTPLWVVSALSVLGAVAVLSWTLIRRFAGPDSTSGPEAESDAKLMLRILEFLEANLELTKQQPRRSDESRPKRG
jgi:hypothetical protein